MRDPIELFDYPKSWIKRCCEANNLKESDVKKLVESGFYIITEKGTFLKRGITTGTTASLAVKACLLSIKYDINVVEVKTPIGIKVRLEVRAEKGKAVAKKFSGDHSFDITNGIEIFAKKTGKKDIIFGKGVGRVNNMPAVSESAFNQILTAYKEAIEFLDEEVGVVVEIPRAMEIYNKTGNRKFGIKHGISILGTTGFVEPWCRELVETKKAIAKRYRKVALTTGRKGFEFAIKNMKYKPIVVGVHIEEFLKELKNNKIVIVGMPSLLLKWADEKLKGEIIANKDLKNIIEIHGKKVLEKARSIADVESVVLIDNKGGILAWLE